MMAVRVVATLIGDVVASREHADRAVLQHALREVLFDTNALLNPIQPLEVTLGDEFQGAFSSPAGAVEASLAIRLALLTHEHGADTRYGVGWGDITVFDKARTPVSQDGPGWWAAREAIGRAKAEAERSRVSFVRTCFAAAGWGEGPQAGAMDAFLLMRDAAVGRMAARQHRLLLGLLRGRTQDELAEREGITQGAVSQALHRSGALAIQAAQERLQDGRP